MHVYLFITYIMSCRAEKKNTEQVTQCKCDEPYHYDSLSSIPLNIRQLPTLLDTIIHPLIVYVWLKK